MFFFFVVFLTLINCQTLISSCTELQNIRNNLNNVSASYKLNNDIDCISINYIPIGTNSSSRFQGLLDGNGYSILNVNISNGNNKYTGIFGYGELATVKNLTLKDTLFF